MPHKNSNSSSTLPLGETVSHNKWYVCRYPGSSHKSRFAAGDGYRNLYIVLLVCGFILRFGFVLWKKTYIGSPNDNIPFGEEICSIADHIVRGQGFSSPFHQDTGPTAWIAPVYPYLVALVFRLFGSYSAASAIVLLGIQCIIAASTGITIHALGRRTFGAQVGFCAAWIWALSPFFSAGQFPGFGILPPAPFFFPRPSSLRSMSRRKIPGRSGYRSARSGR